MLQVRLKRWQPSTRPQQSITKPESQNLSFHRRENLKFNSKFLVVVDTCFV
jgi:hypothetical protein